jgi:hypothetical protein
MKPNITIVILQVGPRYITHLLIATKKIVKLLLPKSSNNGQYISRFNIIILLHTSFQGMLKIILKLLSQVGHQNRLQYLIAALEIGSLSFKQWYLKHKF